MLRPMLARLIALCLLLGAARAQADNTDESQARALFKEGNALAKKGDYAGAVELFRAAYARFPNPKILTNLGAVLHILGRNAEAAEVYETFLQQEHGDQRHRQEVGSSLNELAPLLGKLRVEVNEPGARVLVDGKFMGESPQAITLRVDPGSHAVVAEKQGAMPAVATVTVSAGEERVVDLRLTTKAPAQPPPVAAPLPPRTPEPAGTQPTAAALLGASAPPVQVARAEPHPWYKRWYVWAGAGAVVAGGVAAAFLLKGGETGSQDPYFDPYATR
jgi:PEGA domain-containing protein/tetratricopeptide repeat protein